MKPFISRPASVSPSPSFAPAYASCPCSSDFEELAADSSAAFATRRRRRRKFICYSLDYVLLFLFISIRSRSSSCPCLSFPVFRRPSFARSLGPAPCAAHVSSSSVLALASSCISTKKVSLKKHSYESLGIAPLYLDPAFFKRSVEVGWAPSKTPLQMSWRLSLGPHDAINLHAAQASVEQDTFDGTAFWPCRRTLTCTCNVQYEVPQIWARASPCCLCP